MKKIYFFLNQNQKLLGGARYGSGGSKNMPQRCLGTISGPLQGTTASKKNYKISIFFGSGQVSGAEIRFR